MTAAARTVLHWRLRALPYTYTVHHTAHATGCPIARPLFFAFPADGDSRAASTQARVQRPEMLKQHGVHAGACALRLCVELRSSILQLCRWAGFVAKQH